MISHREGATLVIDATTAPERRALGERAALLGHLRHPGLVNLIEAVECDEGCAQLRCRWVGPDLSRCAGPADPAEVAGLGAAVANILGDLHALGLVHGAVRPEHILLDGDGRPVLCGVGSMRRSHDADLAGADAVDLVATLRTLLPARDAGREWRELRIALRPARRRPSTAAELGRRLAAPKLGGRLWVPDLLDAADPPDVAEPADPAEHENVPAIRLLPVSGLPAPPEPAGSGEAICAAPAAGVPVNDSEGGTVDDAGPPEEADEDHRSGGGTRRRALWVAGGAAALVVALLSVVLGGRSGTASPAAAPGGSAEGARGVPASRCPAVDDGCRPLSLPGGIVTTAAGRFAIGAPGDPVVLGRWDCGPVGLPAVLQPVGGQVWVFDRWPTEGTDVAARPVGRVPGAVSLLVVPGRGGCDRLRVERRAASPVDLQPEVAP